MTKRLSISALLVGTGLALSGCYTVLNGPRLASTLSAPDPYVSSHQPATIGQFHDDHEYDDRYADPWDTAGYGTGYPVMGYDSRYGAYGFGSPFAYGPGLGYRYGAYNAAYGPYGYGYDPYYSYGGYGGGSSSYVPPGYQLVTTQELANLRAENAILRSAGQGSVPTVNQQELQRRQRTEAEQAWTQRTLPTTRKSTTAVRTARPSGTSRSSTTAVSSKPASSSKDSGSKSSGSDAAKRRKKRR